MPRISEELVRRRAEHNEGVIHSLEEVSLHQVRVLCALSALCPLCLCSLLIPVLCHHYLSMPLHIPLSLHSIADPARLRHSPLFSLFCVILFLFIASSVLSVRACVAAGCILMPFCRARKFQMQAADRHVPIVCLYLLKYRTIRCVSFALSSRLRRSSFSISTAAASKSYTCKTMSSLKSVWRSEPVVSILRWTWWLGCQVDVLCCLQFIFQI